MVGTTIAAETATGRIRGALSMRGAHPTGAGLADAAMGGFVRLPWRQVIPAAIGFAEPDRMLPELPVGTLPRSGTA